MTLFANPNGSQQPTGNGQPQFSQPGPAPQQPYAGPSPAGVQPAQVPAFQPQAGPPNPFPGTTYAPVPPQQQPTNEVWQQPQQQFSPQPFAPQQYQPSTSQPSPVVPPEQVVQPVASASDAGQYGQWFSPPPPQHADPALSMAYQQYQQQQAAQAAQHGQQVPGQPQDDWNVDSYFDRLVDAPKWNPAFDHAINNGYVVKDASTGAYVPANSDVAPLAAGIVPALNDYERHRTTVLQDFLSENPYKKVYGALEEPIQHMIRSEAQKLVDQTFQQREQDQFVDRYESDNASWMYQQLPNGQRQPTQAGLQLAHYTQELTNNGVPIDKAIEYAEIRVKPMVAAAQPPPSPSQTGSPYVMPPDQTLPAWQQQTGYQPQMQVPQYQYQPPQQYQPPSQQPQQQYAQGYAPQQQYAQPPSAPNQSPPGQSFFDSANANAMSYQASAGADAAPSATPKDIGAARQELESFFTSKTM